MYFVNLTVKTKMHLDAPRAEGTNCQSLLDYYNLFPKLLKYSNIKPSHFKRKPQRSRVIRKKSVEPIIEEFGNIVNNAEEDEKTDIEHDNQTCGESIMEQK